MAKHKYHTEFISVPKHQDWAQRHLDAMQSPQDEFELAVTSLIRGWCSYALAYNLHFNDNNIGEDSVLGEEWAGIGRSILGLLNGKIGRLDANTIDKAVRKILIAEGYEP